MVKDDRTYDELKSLLRYSKGNNEELTKYYEERLKQKDEEIRRWKEEYSKSQNEIKKLSSHKVYNVCSDKNCPLKKDFDARVKKLKDKFDSWNCFDDCTDNQVSNDEIKAIKRIINSVMKGE